MNATVRGAGSAKRNLRSRELTTLDNAALDSQTPPLRRGFLDAAKYQHTRAALARRLRRRRLPVFVNVLLRTLT